MPQTRRTFLRAALGGVAFALLPSASRARVLDVARPATMYARREFYGSAADLRLDVYAYTDPATAEAAFARLCAWALAPGPDDAVTQTDIKEATIAPGAVGGFGERPAFPPPEFGPAIDAARWFVGNLAGDTRAVVTLVMRGANLVHVWRAIDVRPARLVESAADVLGSGSHFAKASYTPDALLDYLPTAADLDAYNVEMTREAASPLTWR